MARLPNGNALSRAGSFRSGRAILRQEVVGTSGAGQIIAEAVEGFGATAGRVAKQEIRRREKAKEAEAAVARVVEEREQQRDATDAIRAMSEHAKDLNAIIRKVGAEPDFARHGPMFDKEAARLNARLANQVRNPELRKNFSLQAEQQTDAFRTRVLANAVRAEREAARAGIDKGLQTHFELYTDPEGQEPQRVQALAQINDMIVLAQARGLFTPEEAEEKQQRFVIGAVRQDAVTQAARDPQGFLADLEVKNGRFAILPEEDRLAMARAGAGQAVASALDADPAGLEDVLADPLVAGNLSQEQQDRARQDARTRLEAIEKSKRTDAIMGLATETPALVARVNANETFKTLDGSEQPAGPPLTIADTNAMIAQAKQDGARPEALQLHEELHANLIAQEGEKQASVEPETFGQLMQSISDARIVPGKRIDVEASMAALVDVQARVLRAQRLGQITSAQAETLLTRVIPAVMAGIERDGGVGGGGLLSGVAAFYDRALDFVDAVVEVTGLKNNPAFTVPVFTAVEEIADTITGGTQNNSENNQDFQIGSVSAGRRFVRFVVGLLEGMGVRLPKESLSRFARILGGFEPPEDVEKRIEELSKPPEERASDADTDAGIPANADADNTDFIEDAGEPPDAGAEEAGASDGALITRLTDDPQEQDEIRNFLETPEAQHDLLSSELKSFAGDEQLVTRVIAEEKWTITKEEALVLRHYTGRAHRDWNKRTREGKATPTDRKLTALAAQGLDNLPPREGEISRAPVKTADAGDTLWNNAVVGEPLDLGFQLQSFTTDKGLASDLAGEARVIIHAKSTPRGADISKLSQFPDENEILLPPNLTYNVVGMHTETIVLDDGMERSLRIIEVEIVDATP